MNIKEEERLVLEVEKKEELARKIRRRQEIKHFRFTDFAQTIIGVGVFGLPSIINTSFWDYIPRTTLGFMFVVHLFFVFAMVIALNYRFRDNLSLKDRTFNYLFAKRIFYVYFSVMMSVMILLVLVRQVSMDMPLWQFLKNFFAAQSVGLVGAVTFSFFKSSS